MKKKTRFTGVYSYESTQRRHNGRSDVCFYITFREHGKKVWEKIGWKSDGHTAAEAKQVRNRRMRSIGKHSPAPHLQWIDAWEKFDRLHLSTLKLPELDRGRHANHIKPLFNGKTLQEITPLVIQDLRKELLKKTSPRPLCVMSSGWFGECSTAAGTGDSGRGQRPPTTWTCPKPTTVDFAI